MRMISAVFAWLLALVLSVLQPLAQPADRFDMLVRADFFAGFAGDRDRLAQGMAACEKVLTANPSHAEALVWHGSGLAFQAGTAFAAGQQAHGMDLWTTGMREVDRAVELAPDSVSVLIPRGAMLLTATRNMPAEMASPLLKSALANYERVLALQRGSWSSLGDHAKGELLFGLAEGYARLGDLDHARTYFAKLVADAPASGQATRAQAFLETGKPPALPQNGMTCIGCHQ
ncbi:MAG: hypothetical protein U0Q11_28195 [Vicinamibacterales bacterium]